MDKRERRNKDDVHISAWLVGIFTGKEILERDLFWEQNNEFNFGYVAFETQTLLNHPSVYVKDFGGCIREKESGIKHMAY